jgi:hypothetical protein
MNEKGEMRTNHIIVLLPVIIVISIVLFRCKLWLLLMPQERLRLERNNGSNHSNASPISASTTFTKEDGVYLFTSLTDSFMTEMVQRNAEMMATMLESQKKFRDAQIAKEEWAEAAQLAKEEKNEAAQRAREQKAEEKENRNNK